MSIAYTAIPYIMEILGEVPELEGAVITEEFTAPYTQRPVLKTTLSVGLKSMEMTPTTRQSHTSSYVMCVTFYFPCGLGDQDISNTIYKTAAAFSGKVINYMLVESVTVNNSHFNSSLYGVSVEMLLNMRGLYSTSFSQEQTESFTIGNITIGVMPTEFCERRDRSAQTQSMTSSPRIFRIKGFCLDQAASNTWADLQTLMSSDSVIALRLPRDSRTVNVKPYFIETVGNTTGYGFEYTLEFIEAL